ncbi:DUF6461 domain-containing protein [Streptomyces sp. DSM 41640]|uniref:DUF6461 domain-containing protein n=2 Tax=Streptomyces doebereineriae TaxID=3075528 RepID=A0ABU2VNB2_9ACTN|nr:DUF6461 domain-containing protein [Streptomyces sp. DSM 41640]
MTTATDQEWLKELGADGRSRIGHWTLMVEFNGYLGITFADARYGSHPDELLTEMQESGFDLEEREEDGDHDAYYAALTAAAFALALRLTGIRLTPELFATAEFLCAVAPVPRG